MASSQEQSYLLSLQPSYFEKVQEGGFFQVVNAEALEVMFQDFKKNLSAESKKKIGWGWKVKLPKKEDVLEWAQTQEGQTDYNRLAMYFYNFDEITESIIAKFFTDTGVFHEKFADAQTINSLHKADFHFISVGYLALSFDPPESFQWSNTNLCMLKANGLTIPGISIEIPKDKPRKTSSPIDLAKDFVFAEHLNSPTEKLWSLTQISFTGTTWLSIKDDDQLELLVESFGGEKLAEFVKEQYPRPKWGIAIVAHVRKLSERDDRAQLLVKDAKQFNFAHDNRSFFERSIPPFYAIPPDWSMDAYTKTKYELARGTFFTMFSAPVSEERTVLLEGQMRIVLSMVHRAEGVKPDIIKQLQPRLQTIADSTQSQALLKQAKTDFKNRSKFVEKQEDKKGKKKILEKKYDKKRQERPPPPPGTPKCDNCNKFYHTKEQCKLQGGGAYDPSFQPRKHFKK
jgi:hypothetical protein